MRIFFFSYQRWVSVDTGRRPGRRQISTACSILAYCSNYAEDGIAKDCGKWCASDNCKKRHIIVYLLAQGAAAKFVNGTFTSSVS